MRIGIDARNFCNSQKNAFADFIKALSKTDKQNSFNIYCNWFEKINVENFKIIDSSNYLNFFWEQVLFLSRLKKDNNDVVISFEETFPVWYKNRYYQIVNDLEQVLYPNLRNSKFLKKYSYLYRKKSNLKNAKKIICYHEKTKVDINEKLNIEESKIEVIKWFFYKCYETHSLVNIKNKHSITWDYIIYNSWVWNSKNIKRLLESLKEVNKKTSLTLVVLWNDATKDIEFREIVINLWLTQKVLFLWEIVDQDITQYYKQALFVIHPPIYDSFPFCLSEAINFSSNILSSDLVELKDIFKSNVNYFNALSKNDLITKMESFKQAKVDYSEILKNYDCQNFVNKLLKTI